jgi:CRP-like cAMP-binding protein
MLGFSSSDGLLEVMQNGKLLGEMHPRTAFGELAILYNCKRTATVKGGFDFSPL